jgi:hypothetical protein
MSKAKNCPKVDNASLRGKQFQSWWGNTFSFYADKRLSRSYQPAFNDGADITDLEYLEFLRISLRAWDTLAKEINVNVEKERRVNVNLDLSRLPKTPPLIIKFFAIDAMMAMLKAQLTNPHLTAEQLERFVQESWDNYIQKQKSVRSVKERFWQECSNIAARERLPLFLSFIEAVRALEKHTPVGRKADPAGSLFLLAVSERLKTLQVHNRNIIARRMLATLRPEVKSSAIAQRVSKLKHSYKSWKSLLKKLDDGFERYQATPKNVREERKPILPNYPEFSSAQLKMLLDVAQDLRNPGHDALIDLLR